MSKVTTRKQRLPREQINIKGEVEYIARCAAAHDARVVALGSRVFFSTETGDAWLLDPSDHLALCLARDGDSRPVNIMESAGTCAIGWDMTYQISGDRFVVADLSGQSRTIIGYLIREIADAIQPSPEIKRGDRPKVARQIEPLFDEGYDRLSGRCVPMPFACHRSIVQQIGRYSGTPDDILDGNSQPCSEHNPNPCRRRCDRPMRRSPV